MPSATTILIASVIFYFGAFFGPAHAYIDPAAGSVIMSALIATSVAVGVYVRMYWDKFKRLIGLNKRPPSRSDTNDD